MDMLITDIYDLMCFGYFLRLYSNYGEHLRTNQALGMYGLYAHYCGSC
jgi:hypothetical protein